MTDHPHVQMDGPLGTTSAIPRATPPVVAVCAWCGGRYEAGGGFGIFCGRACADAEVEAPAINYAPRWRAFLALPDDN